MLSEAGSAATVVRSFQQRFGYLLCSTLSKPGVIQHMRMSKGDTAHVKHPPSIHQIDACLQVFYPVVFLYMLAAFFQGGAGTGSSGMLNNARSYLWIPIGQNAFRCLSSPP